MLHLNLGLMVLYPAAGSLIENIGCPGGTIWADSAGFPT
jgi:hypothetical protein